MLLNFFYSFRRNLEDIIGERHMMAHQGCLNSSKMKVDIHLSKVKLATLVEGGGDRKAPFPIATIPRCRGGRYFIPWIAPLYP